MVEKLQMEYDRVVNDMCDLWDKYKTLDSQKDFALNVVRHPLSAVLFAARKNNLEPRAILPQFQGRVVDILTEYKKSVKL